MIAEFQIILLHSGSMIEVFFMIVSTSYFHTSQWDIHRQDYLLYKKYLNLHTAQCCKT